MRDGSRDWERVVTSDSALSLLLPPDWEVETPAGTDAVLIASPSDGVDPVLVVSREVGFAGSASEYRTANVIHLQESCSMPDYADHGGGTFDADGHEIAWHAYSYGTDRGRLRVTIFFATSGGGAYLVNCGVREAHIDAHRSTIETIGRSIRPETTRADGA